MTAATNYTLALIKAAREGMARTWREVPGDEHWRYSKTSVNTTDLKLLEKTQRALIGQFGRERSAPLMTAMDECNWRF